MSENFQCGDNVALVAYLYDECAADERSEIEAHLAICAVCAAEAAALRSTRLQLTSWMPPGAELGFQIVRAQAADRGRQDGAVGVKPGAWWRQPLPAWAQAAAAVLLFGTGLWLGVAQGTDGTAAPQAAPPAATLASAAAAAPPAPIAVSADDLAALESRLRGEIARIRSVATTPADRRLLTEVRSMIDESEQRQQRELALGMTRLMRDVETQRRTDLAQIQGSFQQIEGLTGAQVREQRDMLNYLMRVSQQGR
jgi:anti-sigma factor RsiW